MLTIHCDIYLPSGKPKSETQQQFSQTWHEKNFKSENVIFFLAEAFSKIIQIHKVAVKVPFACMASLWHTQGWWLPILVISNSCGSPLSCIPNGSIHGTIQSSLTLQSQFLGKLVGWHGKQKKIRKLAPLPLLHMDISVHARRTLMLSKLFRLTLIRI